MNSIAESSFQPDVFKPLNESYKKNLPPMNPTKKIVFHQ